MNISNLSASQFRHAATLKEKIESLQGELNRLLGGSVSNMGSAPKAKRTMSASARAKIAAAQRARWAKQKAGKK